MARRKKLTKNFKEWVATIIMIASTSIIVFNNAGQSIQLLQIVIPTYIYYWVAGLSLLAGVIWEAYLNKIIRLN